MVTERRPVAVTGLGMVTPLGIGAEASWAGVSAGRSSAGLDPALTGTPVPMSCRVPGFDAARLLGGKACRRLDRFVQLALVAAHEAVADAGLDPSSWNGARVAVILGSALGGVATIEEQHQLLMGSAPDRVSPLLLPMQMPNMLAGLVSIELRATGQSMVAATACASGATAIGLALDLLSAGRCDVVVTGGSEAGITPLVMTGFARLGVLSRRTQAPDAASRPFDADRDGFVAGEGAAILVLERTDDAQARGARIRARLLGSETTADAYHMTTPDPSGTALERAIRSALADAGISAAEVDHVNAHATGTPQGDRTEAAVLARVFDRGPVVTSTKGATGHLLGAAGAVEAALAVMTIEHGFIPPTVNLDRQDPQVQLNLAAKPLARPVAIAASCSSGFGGQNTVLLLGEP